MPPSPPPELEDDDEEDDDEDELEEEDEELLELEEEDEEVSPPEVSLTGHGFGAANEKFELIPMVRFPRVHGSFMLIFLNNYLQWW